MRFVELVVVLQHVFQQRRRIEAVGAAGGADAAVDAVVDLLHLGIPFIGHVRLPRGAAEKHIHPRGIVDFDPDSAGQAVTAAAAEGAGEFLAFLRDEGRGLIIH